MKRWLSRLPVAVEALIVCAIIFGPFLYGCGMALWQQTTPVIDNAALWQMLLLEPPLMLVAGVFLWLRGWRPRDLGLGFDVRSTLETLALFSVTWLVLQAIALSVLSLDGISEAQLQQNSVQPNLNLVLLLAVCVINPLYEELFVTGYVITALQRRYSPFVAVNVSVALRLAYHLYQGQLGVMSVIPLGLIFALYFVRSGHLWPVILAHALFDLISLLLSRLQ